MSQYYETEINLRELVVKVLKHWRKIALWAVIFAAALGGLKAFLGFRNLKDEEFLVENAREVDTAVGVYEAQKATYQAQIDTLVEEIRTQNAYRESSLYMNIDPYNEYKETVTYYVSTDMPTLQGIPYQGINTAISLINAYALTLDDEAKYKEAAKEAGLDVPASALRELVSTDEEYEKGLLTISVVGNDEQLVGSLMEKIRRGIEDSHDRVAASVTKHEITDVFHVSEYCVDEDLALKLSEFDKNLNTMQTTLNQKRTAQDALQEPKEEKLTEEKAVADTVKFAVIGLILGAALAVVGLSAGLLLKDAIPGEEILRDKFGLRLLGRYPVPGTAGKKNAIDRRILKMEDADTWSRNEAQHLDSIAAALCALVSEGDTVAFIGNADISAIEGLCGKLAAAEELEGIKIAACGDILADPAKTRQFASADSVVIAENTEKTSRRKFVKMLDIAGTQNKIILGLVEIIE